MFENLSGINLSRLDKCEIRDSNDENIGRLIDAVLKKTDKGMQLTKFVVGDSKIVEFLEKINLRPDVDPVFKTEVIKSISPQSIKLSVAKDELKSTHVDEDVLDEDEFKLTELRKTPVIDSRGNNIGRVIDLTFDEDNFQLILGDSVAKEWAEAVGFQPDVDFLISPKYIESFSKEEIVLSKKKSDLKSTFLVNLDEYQGSQQAKKQGDLAKSKSTYFPRHF